MEHYLARVLNISCELPTWNHKKMTHTEYNQHHCNLRIQLISDSPHVRSQGYDQLLTIAIAKGKLFLLTSDSISSVSNYIQCVQNLHIHIR